MKVIKETLKPPVTAEFPKAREALTDNYRGLHRLNVETCISCSACATVCPNRCIEMVEADTDKGVKPMPEIHLDRCLFCGYCEEVCPTKCLILTKNTEFEADDRRKFVKGPLDLD